MVSQGKRCNYTWWFLHHIYVSFLGPRSWLSLWLSCKNGFTDADMERPWKEHAIMHFADKFAQVTQFVCDRWAVPQVVGYCMLLPPSTQAYARIRQFGTVGSQLQSIPTKHFCHQDAATLLSWICSGRASRPNFLKSSEAIPGACSSNVRNEIAFLLCVAMAANCSW